MMDKRIRSPNYPAFGLPEALDKIQTLYKAQHTHAAPREVVAQGLGYTGLNGASATSISALHKYGLLEKVGDEVKVSERALRILHPHSPAEKAAAIREAAFEPALYSELAERFPGTMPSDELLRNFLLRKGFAPAAVSAVILGYRETSEFVAREAASYDSSPAPSQGNELIVHPTASQPSQQPTITPLSAQQNQGIKIPISENERLVARYDLEGGAYVQIVATSDVPTEEALDWIEVLIANKRRELEMRNRRRASRASDLEEIDE